MRFRRVSTHPSNGNGRRRVLVVAYAFPPCGGAGVQRIAKTVMYLADFGWDTSVLTVEPSCYGTRDESHDIGQGRVVRTPCFDPVTKYRRAGETKQNAAGQSTPNRREWPRSVARSAWIAIERSLLVPDRFVLWHRRAVRAGIRMHVEAPFDVIYATGEPYSAFLIAKRLAHRLKLPFVLDMRDPWTLSPYRSDLPGRTRAAIERWQEGLVLKTCAGCIFANGAIDSYRAEYPELCHKFHYIPNGYDPADFAGVTSRVFDRFTVVHNGTFLAGYRTADTFLHAVRQVVDFDPATRKRLQVLLVGKIGPERELSARLGLQDVVTHLGYRPHHESLSYVLGADALLLVGGRHAWEETGKVFEYLAAGKPILAQVEPGGAAETILRDSTVAHCVTRNSVAETYVALKALVAAGRQTAAPPPDWLKNYERRHLAGRTAEILTAAVSEQTVVNRVDSRVPVPEHR